MQLHIEAPGGDVHTYRSSESPKLIKGDFKVKEGLSPDGEVELSDVDLALPELFGLGGLDGYEALPDDARTGYRAELRGGGQLVTDGLVYLDDIDYDDPSETYGMTLLSGAARELWRRLGLVDMQLLGEAATALLEERSVEAVVQAPSSRLPRVGAYRTVSLKELTSVVRAALKEADETQEGNLVFEVPPLWTYRVTYHDGGTPHTLTREASVFLHSASPEEPVPVRRQGGDQSLPNWTGEKLVDEVKTLAGWRTKAAFRGFPGRGLDVEFFPDREPPGFDPSTLPVLDRRRMDGNHGVRRRRPKDEDFALKYSGDIGASSPEQRHVRVDGDVTGARAKEQYVAVPPAWATYAPEAWSIQDASEGEEETPRDAANDSVTSSAFGLGRIAYGPGDMPHVDVAPGPSHPGFEERLHHGRPMIPIGEKPWLFSLADVQGVTRAVHYREALGQSDTRIYSGHWAGPAYEGQRLSRRTAYERDGIYDMRGVDYDLARIDKGVRTLGRPWMVTQIERRPKTGEQELLMRSPLTDDAPSPALPVEAGRVTELTVEERQEVDNRRDGRGETSPAPRHYFAISWAPPPARSCRALRYQVQERGGDGWGTTFNHWGTEHLSLIGDDEAQAGTYRWRVRVIDLDGSPGEWDEITHRKY